MPSPTRHAVPRASRTPDPEFLAGIDQALAAATTQGYTELLGQMDVLREDIEDKDKLLRAAIKSIGRTLGINPAQILAAVQERLQLLENERVEVESLLATQAQEKIAGNQQIVQESGRRIKTIDDQIKALQQSRVTEERKAEEAQGKIDSVDTEVKEVKDRFTSAYNLRAEELARVLTDLRASMSIPTT